MWGETAVQVLHFLRRPHVAGRVVAAESGMPVSGALVEAEDHNERCARTDAAGAFRLDHLAAENLRLIVRAGGFLRRTFTVDDEVVAAGAATLREGETTEVVLRP